jgi:hypothetical protein
MASDLVNSVNLLGGNINTTKNKEGLLDDDHVCLEVNA